MVNDTDITEIQGQEGFTFPYDVLQLSKIKQNKQILQMIHFIRALASRIVKAGLNEIGDQLICNFYKILYIFLSVYER